MADKEYAIWRAIGSLTQRVRDLEQPTPAPEPPRAGQVPSVTELTFALWETGSFQKRATAQDCARHLVNKFGSRTVQPQPVTAEKLADEMMRYCTQARDIPFRWDKFAEHVLKAFPALGQGRLTREQIEDALRGHVSSHRLGEITDDLLALQG